MLELAYPWFLLLILLPLLWWRRRRHQADQVAAPEIPVGHWLSDLPGVSRSGNRRSIWHSLMLLAAWTLLVVALARPQYIGEAVELPVTGRDLLLAVDISPSMEEEDMVLGQRQVNRLIAVKNVLNSFITQREGDRLGLLLFGTQPYIQAPLSFDHDTIRTLLQEAQIGMAGRATAIGDAIGLAVKRLRNRPQEQRVLILLTDGANTAGEVSPDKAADIAASAGVRVYTIGMGAESMIQRGFLGSRRVNPSRDLDEALLKRIADKTGGQYFRARSTPELELIYENINQLEPIELEGKHYRPTKALYYWPAGIALALLVLGYAITFVSDRKTGGHA
ncbi:VWA domain-containing protein [Marinobacter sp. BGYM27]|uniref:vWA domain-containing protein n=1 Tax=unclassified Marinobacter TaxID=83889 RepID=UPI0021A887F9|nr:VWA domain-containing protein [Marinobacter sp. BGYM27]MDG5498634.1 VWA domain-containing protein [Marinobacter sp. BGYM27]